MTIPMVDVGPLLDPGLATARPELQTDLVGAVVPLALLPVRLEARFFPVAGGGSELRVRVYPDKIHLDSHDPELSASEVAAGKAYWEQRWADETRHQQAWALLTQRFEPGRAAYIARALTPRSAPPDFPDLGQPAAVTRTPVARALPTRWVATAYRNAAVVGVGVGRDCTGSLPVGPDLDPSLAPTVSDDTPAVDEGMRWMVDFARAEEVGMALRVPLEAGFGDAEVDVLVVTGIGDGSSDIADLLDCHHFTDGLELLAPATPSNNTAEERAGWASRDLRGTRSFHAEWSDDAVAPGSSAGVLATALGLTPDRASRTLGRISGAESDDSTPAEAMTTALWPATWGYYLTQMVGMAGGGVGAALTMGDVDFARAHAQHFVRPAGHLPILRAGRQPYGVLPVTSLNRWVSPDEPRLGVLRGALARLRDGLWRPAQGSVPRVGATSDPSGDLVDVLRSDGLPATLRVRRLMGPHFLRHLQLLLGEDLDADGFWLTLQALSSSAVAQTDLGFLPAAARLVYEGASSPVVAPLVGDDLTYLTDLLTTDDIDALAPPPAQSVPVLHALVRHGLLREHALLAARLLASADLPLASLVRDAELVDLVTEQTPTPSWRWQRDQTQPGSTRTIREAIADVASLPPEDARSLGEFREAVATLARTDGRTLERHLLNTLAATAYRLDAWVTSFAARRLAVLRAATPTGLVIGGYGWLEGLRPQPATTAPVVADEPGPLLLAADDPGFIHAPSLDQASTAALLRNAHLAHGGGKDNPYAISLTSSRVRGAQRLLDGVRQGQSLGALLGYDFERSLHEAQVGNDPKATLDDLLDDFRRMAPPKGVDPDDAVSRRVLLDGLELVRRWREDPATLLSPISGTAPEGSPRHEAVVALLNRLDRALDGVADAVTAESVHQLVRGNLDRASSTLEDITTGDASPPELQHQRTPRSGLPVTHRVAIVLDPDAPPSSGWASTSVRAGADPAANAWVGRLLGPATAVAVELSLSQGSVPPVPLASLGLTPMDLMRLSLGASGRDELALRAYHAAAPEAQRTQGVRATLSPRVSGDRAGVTVWDLLEVASSAYTLISKARPLDGDDLQPPQAATAPAVDLDDYADRAAAALAALRRTRDDLAAANTPELLGTALRDAADFGIAAPLDTTPPPLVSAVLAELDRRLVAADASATPAPGEDDAAQRARIVRLFTAVFGPGFVPTVRFTLPDPAALRASLGDEDALTGGDPLAGATWSLRMSRLRDQLFQLGIALREAEAIGGQATPEPRLAQLPHVAGQRWVGLPTEGDLSEGVVSLALHGDLGNLDRDLSGFLVDEWTEIVPNRHETTGIAFRYDPPDAAPPQAILLAVPPVDGEPWTVGTLNQVLLETLDMAHLRACGPAELQPIGQYLPAAVLAFNLVGDAVSTDLNPLTPEVN